MYPMVICCFNFTHNEKCQFKEKVYSERQTFSEFKTYLSLSNC